MLLDPPLPEVAFVGRSNVGKSSLLNALVGRRIAKISGTPGKTRALNVFLIPELGIGAPVYFLDLPGYGYARVGKAQRAAFRGLVKHTLRRDRLRGVVWLLDIRHSLSADDQAMQDALAEEEKTHVLAALTKGDKLSSGKRTTRERELREELGLPEDAHSYALLPIGWPLGRFGPVGRQPLGEVVFEDRWGQPYSGM